MAAKDGWNGVDPAVEDADDHALAPRGQARAGVPVPDRGGADQVVAGIGGELVDHVGLDCGHAGHGGDLGHLGRIGLDHDRVEDVAVAGLDLDRAAELLAEPVGDLGLLDGELVQVGLGRGRGDVDRSGGRLLGGQGRLGQLDDPETGVGRGRSRRDRVGQRHRGERARQGGGNGDGDRSQPSTGDQ